MKSIVKLIIGLCALFLWGVLNIHTPLFPWSAKAIEDKVLVTAEDALSPSAKEWAKLEISGQHVTLSGIAPTQEALDQASAALVSASYTSRIASVDSASATVDDRPPFRENFTLVAQRENGVISLSGHVQDQIQRDEIFATTLQYFPDDTLASDITIARGSVSAAEWKSAFMSSLQVLSSLNPGTVEVNNYDITISGDLIEAIAPSTIETVTAQLPATFTVASDIAVTAPQLAPAIVEEQLAQNEQEPSASIQSQITPCYRDLQSHLANNKIDFQSDRSELNESARGYLTQLAKLMRNCSDARIQITGHTDLVGGARGNLQLSVYRAAAVGAYLQALGIPRRRLRSIGLGETAPLVEGDNPAAHARNRRIEISIIEDDPQP